MSEQQVVICVDDFEQFARKSLPKMMYEYFQSGSDDETTLHNNFAAFKRYFIIPRVLRDVSNRDTSTTILGHRISLPVCIGPSACHRIAHTDGEMATAKGAHAAETCMVLSLHSTCTIEEVRTAAPNAMLFMQFEAWSERAATVHLIHQVEQAGFKALVLTTDIPMMSKRRKWLYNNFGLPSHLRLAIIDDIKFTELEQPSYRRSPKKELALSWSYVQWLRSVSSLPIIVKGILSVEDAISAVEHGASGILVSNHGGRQLNHTPAAIDVLAEIVDAVAGRCEVYVDGGVRTGTDVLTALALGARAVFIGRPAMDWYTVATKAFIRYLIF